MKDTTALLMVGGALAAGAILFPKEAEKVFSGGSGGGYFRDIPTQEQKSGALSGGQNFNFSFPTDDISALLKSGRLSVQDITGGATSGGQAITGGLTGGINTSKEIAGKSLDDARNAVEGALKKANIKIPSGLSTEDLFNIARYESGIGGFTPAKAPAPTLYQNIISAQERGASAIEKAYNMPSSQFPFFGLTKYPIIAGAQITQSITLPIGRGAAGIGEGISAAIGKIGDAFAWLGGIK